MEVLLGKVTQQAMNYAIRSGIAITSTYAISQCSRLLKTVKGTEYEELSALQDRLESKIRIISPAIDMIELISARGNTSLESAVTLTKALRWEIQSLGLRLAKAANTEELSRRAKIRTRGQSEAEVKIIIQAIRKLLERIEDAVPLINLAITTSGASLSTTLPATVSPSRLLQASTFLTAGDTQYSIQPGSVVQIGPAFSLSMYMLFSGHAYRQHDQDGNMRETTWKEVMHKARVKLLRTPLEEFQGQVGNRDQANPDPLASDLLAGEGKADEFAYQLAIVEDFNDDRVHSFEDDEPQPSRHDDVELAGIRELIPIHQISKIFYADTGKILNIGSEGEANSPVLLLKRDVHAIPPRRMIDRGQVRSSRYGDDSSRESQHGRSEFYDDPSAVEDQPLHASAVLGGQQPTETDPWRLPPNLDPEWIAFEVYVEHEDSDDDDEAAASDVDAVESPRPSIRSREPSVDPQLANALALLHLNSPGTTPTSQQQQQQQQQQLILRSPLPLLANSTFSGGGSSPIRTSLSLLEMLIRLTALQQFQQASHLSIPDELLNFFLSESSTTGAGVDGEERRRKRWEARRKVGFDPYDESPVKRRGETGGGRTTDRQRSYELAEDDDDDADHEHEHDRWFSSPPHHRASSSQSSQSILPLPYANSENPSPMLLRSRRNRDALHWSTPSPMSSTSMSSRAPNLNSSPNHDPPPGRAPPEHAQSSPSGPGPAPGSDGLRSRSAALRDDLASSRAKQGSPLRRTHTVQGQDDVVESATMSRPADKRGDER